jgi:hypothetical protein
MVCMIARMTKRLLPFLVLLLMRGLPWRLAH